MYSDYTKFLIKTRSFISKETQSERQRIIINMQISNIRKDFDELMELINLLQSLKSQPIRNWNRIIFLEQAIDEKIIDYSKTRLYIKET